MIQLPQLAARAEQLLSGRVQLRSCKGEVGCVGWGWKKERHAGWRRPAERYLHMNPCPWLQPEFMHTGSPQNERCLTSSHSHWPWPPCCAAAGMRGGGGPFKSARQLDRLPCNAAIKPLMCNPCQGTCAVSTMSSAKQLARPPSSSLLTVLELSPPWGCVCGNGFGLRVRGRRAFPRASMLQVPHGMVQAQGCQQPRPAFPPPTPC